MNDDLDQIRTLLTKPEPTAQVVEAGRARLTDPPRTRNAPSRRRSYPRTPALAAGLVGAVAVAALGVAMLGEMPGGSPSPGNGDQIVLTGSQVLRQSAVSAESLPTATSTYWYYHSQSTFEDNPDAPGSLEEERWTGKDGQAWAADDGEEPYQVRNDGTFYLCDKSVGYQAIAGLPAEPSALRARLRDAAMHGDDGAVPAERLKGFVSECTADLMQLPITPDVRAAAFRSLAEVPDTENLGQREDAVGRVGTGLRLDMGEGDLEVIVDSDTAAILQTDGTTILDATWTDNVR